MNAQTNPVIFCSIIATDLQSIIIGRSSAVSLTEDVSWTFVPDMYNVYCSIVSSASVRNSQRTQRVSCTKTNHDSRSQTHASSHINCLPLSSGFEYYWRVWTDVSTVTSKCNISRKSVRQDLSCSTWTDGRTELAVTCSTIRRMNTVQLLLAGRSCCLMLRYGM